MDAGARTGQVSLVIPAFNEAGSIEQAIREAEWALVDQFESFEVLVVDDGSTDETVRVVERTLPHAAHTRLLRHGTNRGYGAALRSGFEAARYDLVAFTDADSQFDLADLGKLARHAINYPIVVGYRLDRQDSWRRRFFSWGYNRLARTFLGTDLRDVDCALKVFRREMLAPLMPESHGFFVNTEMMTRARQLGLNIREVPVKHRPRSRGDSKVSLREIPRTAATLLRFWWREVAFGTRSAPVTTAVYQGRVKVSNEVSAQVPSPRLSNSSPHPAERREQHREAA